MASMSFHWLAMTVIVWRLLEQRGSSDTIAPLANLSLLIAFV
jgi:hypothetical protein